ncbi:hypothetical protein HH310_34455 [Actinoplanes sp. TBRC 11911]|uniref:hypothetical protein n=1 Tax=Actinoplanes sp. TBRC 11911 TaxID=2729386 RepID=UPI00145FBB47|nr:hypothetical protein [Actinoplanes sp. TBRC 11911]NMO56267.1 hypothetical protein [Actinoplanes sp. TBRC 11911]
MTEELRALLRSELDAERPPPIGDIVGAAMAAGRRARRVRRQRRVALGAGLVAVLVLAGLLLRDEATPSRAHVPVVADGTGIDPHVSMPSLSPETVPMMTSAPTGSPRERTVTSHDGTARAGGEQKKATSAAMLQLLTELVRPAKTGEYGVSAGDDLSVRLFVDSGAGAGMLAVTVGRGGAGTLTVDVAHTPGDCSRTTTVTADRPDGVRVRLDIASCPAGGALTAGQGVAVVSDPRWGFTMDAGLVDAGARRFPVVPVAGR